jgi:hypothetical protein
MERREEQMCYELERRLIGLLQKDDYRGCFSVVEDALANPDLDVRLTKAMLVPRAYNIARIVGDTALMNRRAVTREITSTRNSKLSRRDVVGVNRRHVLTAGR